jgi:sugar/nucleoside kinase (ribokinase family)
MRSRSMERRGSRFNPGHDYNWEEEEACKGLESLSAFSLDLYFEKGREALNKPALIIKRTENIFSLIANFDSMAADKAISYVKQKHKLEEFSVVVPNTDSLSEVDLAFARAAVQYLAKVHGVDFGIRVSADEIKLMIDALLSASPKSIEMKFDVLWSAWKIENKDLKIEEVEFKLKRKAESLALMVGHKTKVTTEEEIIEN